MDEPLHRVIADPADRAPAAPSPDRTTPPADLSEAGERHRRRIFPLWWAAAFAASIGLWIGLLRLFHLL